MKELISFLSHSNGNGRPYTNFLLEKYNTKNLWKAIHALWKAKLNKQKAGGLS